MWAGATGLEPAASGVTGRRSNQLNYAPAWDTPSFARAREVYQMTRILPTGRDLQLAPLSCIMEIYHPP